MKKGSLRNNLWQEALRGLPKGAEIVGISKFMPQAIDWMRGSLPCPATLTTGGFMPSKHWKEAAEYAEDMARYDRPW